MYTHKPCCNTAKSNSGGEGKTNTVHTMVFDIWYNGNAEQNARSSPELTLHLLLQE
jgi:hypothetical protein